MNVKLIRTYFKLNKKAYNIFINISSTILKGKLEILFMILEKTLPKFEGERFSIKLVPAIAQKEFFN